MNDRSSGSSTRASSAYEGVGTARSGPHLTEHAGEFLGQGPRHHGDGAGQGLLESQAGLDADGQQVEDVGQLPAHGQLALGHHAVEPGVGADEARRCR